MNDILPNKEKMGFIGMLKAALFPRRNDDTICVEKEKINNFYEEAKNNLSLALEELYIKNQNVVGVRHDADRKKHTVSSSRN